MRVGRILLLLSLLGVIFAFVKSEQFGGGTTKITSLDFSKDGKWLAVGQNHAVEEFNEEYTPYLSEISRSVFLLNSETQAREELLRESVPVEQIGDPEWLRVLGQLPNYDVPRLPFSPVQFLPESKRLAVYDFAVNGVVAIDTEKKTRETLCVFPPESEFTLGWFRVLDDEISVIVENQEFELSRFLMKDGKLDERLPLGRPFYMNSVQLSLGPFIPVRMMPAQIKLPSPTYGVSLHPEIDELAVSSVMHILQLNFKGEKVNRLFNKMKTGSIGVYSPTGKKIFALYHNIIRVIDLEKFETVARITHEDEMITALAMRNDGSMFATGDNTGVVRLWDGTSHKMISKTRLGSTWKVDWRVPFALGFLWATLAFLYLGFSHRSKRRRPNFGSRDGEPAETT